jgi:aminoglycoside 6'-N-acetyltransferase I
MSVEIIAIHKNNAGLLDTVSDGVFDNAVRREYLGTFLADPRSLLLVAVVNGTVVGMASGIFYTHPDKPLQLFVNEIGVAEAYQRQGLGKRLVTAILDQASAKGCNEAWVATEEGNTAARALYIAAAAREDPDRAVVYTWSLNAVSNDA